MLLLAAVIVSAATLRLGLRWELNYGLLSFAAAAFAAGANVRRETAVSVRLLDGVAALAAGQTLFLLAFQGGGGLGMTLLALVASVASADLLHSRLSE